MNRGHNFKLQISFRRTEDDGPVFQKQDGERFDSSITVKLNVNTKYTVFLTTRPARPVKRVVLKGEKLDVDRQKPQRSDDDCGVYHTDWSTIGQFITKSNKRIYLPIIIEMEDGSTVETKMQTKLYPEKESSHSRWGQEFHMLDLDCTQKPGQHVVDIRKEMYI
ncbi:hypothetical protein EGW08_007974 [Elysia chlorotica]|uniref:CB1 cannabinoid receptor-interacting protein 1 n=1 Tax=Elysia chlorotica TaxID=188477 RepID=A0A433TRX2_ELYCH|nr:hypothetical protein EGW08_007974 [Elysia chlorotica]